MPFSPQLFFTEEQRLFQMFQMGPAFSRVGGSIAKRDFPGGGGGGGGPDPLPLLWIRACRTHIAFNPAHESIGLNVIAHKIREP